MTVVEVVAAGDAAAAAPPTGNGQTVCVTGAAGYIASWLVKLLLEKGYTVKGTVRNPERAPEGARRRRRPAGPLQGRPPRLRRHPPRRRRLPRRLPHRVPSHRRPRANGGAGGEGHTVRDRRGGGGRHGAADGAHLLHRRRHHGPQPRAGRGRRRVMLERPRLLQENQELVLLREGGGGAGGVGVGAAARGGPGGGEPGAGDRPAAAADGERQHRPHPQVPGRVGQQVRQRRAGVRGRPRRGRRPPPRLRVRRRVRPPPLRRARPPPRGRRAHPRQALPRVPRPHQVLGRGEPEEAAIQDVKPEAPGPRTRVQAGEPVPVRDGEEPPGEGSPPGARRAGGGGQGNPSCRAADRGYRPSMRNEKSTVSILLLSCKPGSVCQNV